MQTVDILLLSTLALVLLGGLVALGIGHRRWSIGTVVAGFLVLLSAATYVYLAARLASRDQAWARAVDDYKARLVRAEDGDVGPPGRGPKSLLRMRERRDRWRRGRERVENWSGRVWQGVSFQPPRDDKPGRVELAAEANTEDGSPIGAGSRVFLFDALPYEEGGVYIGEFLVQSADFDDVAKRRVLTVVQTEPPDAYDAKVLARPHDAVTVFEELPVDRWLAFYRSRAAEGEAADGVALPEIVKEDAEKVGELMATPPDVGNLVRAFVDTFAMHEQDVPEEEWDAAAAEAADEPGALWAEVEFMKPHSFREGEEDATEEEVGGPKLDFEAGEEAEFDLTTALQVRDTPPKPGEEEGPVLVLKRVFRRRPLTDPLTFLHGAQPAVGEGPEAAVRSEGVATLRRLLEREIAALERSNEQLRTAQTAAVANTDDQQRVAGELEQDLKSWARDVRAATELAAGFERALARTSRSLAAAENAIVERGRELTAAMDLLAREIDRAAPPPERRAARP